MLLAVYFLVLPAFVFVLGEESESTTSTVPSPASEGLTDHSPTAGEVAAANAFPLQSPPDHVPTSSGVPTQDQMFAQAQGGQPMLVPGAEQVPFQFKPETKDELFARIDVDNDQAVSLDDYMKRDRYYVESVKNEFNEIDTDQDSKVTKQEFDDYIKKLEEQRRLSLLRSSNFTLQRHDTNHDGMLSENELSHYINDTLQRSVAHLHEVFKEFDKDGDNQLNLEEFSELDFHFPWDKFPLNESAYKQVFFGAGPAAGPPPPQIMQDAMNIEHPPAAFLPV